MPEHHSLTAYVSEFAVSTRYEDIPDDVMRLGKKSILDALGVGLSGSISAPGRIVRDYLRGLGCSEGGASVIGSALRLQPRFAAFANGIAMHADDFDDTLQAETGRYQGVHPTSPVLAAVLAVAESTQLSGKQLLAAYHVGVEVCCRVFDATHVNHTLNGFHVTGTCGTIGAAAGMANLARVSEKTARTMLGIAGSMSSGLQANVGTMVKSFHAGHAAECAIVTYDLGARGFSASPIVLESPRGFFRAQGGGHEDNRIRGKLGKPWSFVDRGIWLKPFPTGSLGHPGMTKLLELILKHDIKPQQVAKIRVKTSESNYYTLQHHRPQTELEAKFSFEFFVAALLVERKCGLPQFTDEFVNSREVQQMVERVEYTTYSDAEARANGYNIVTTFLEIELKEGKAIAARADHGKGNIANPMSEEEVAAKFRDCAEYARWPKIKTERAIELILRLEALSDVSEVTALLSARS